MNILLVSGYELGHQPYHLGIAASHLVEDGHRVRCLDLQVEAAENELFEWADAVGISVPMHTAARLGVEFARTLHSSYPDMPIVFYGLYAHVAVDAFVSGTAELDKRCSDPPLQVEKARGLVVGIAGEYPAALRRWAVSVEENGITGDSAGPLTSQVTVTLDRQKSIVPARHLLPSLDRYARLAWDGEERLVGYVEAATGCSHRCRHCPVPIVYAGRIRKAAIEAVLEDVGWLVEHGASHITFGDPDFLNAPSFASELVSELHSAFPGITFDCTAKVEHVLRYEDLWQQLAERGLLFVVSAFETTNSEVLKVLDKGHLPEDFPRAVTILRTAGVEVRPSFLPFTPWAHSRDLLNILELCVELDLVANVDPVQYSLKLLVPKGSLLLETPELRAYLGDYDSEAMSFRWKARDPATIVLQQKVAEVASRAAMSNLSLRGTLEQIGKEILLASKETMPEDPAIKISSTDSDFLAALLSAADPEKVKSRPKLTEAWFCCAEPTSAQLQSACGTAQVCA